MGRADVLVVGGGFAGAAVANALADSRKVVVLEAHAERSARFAGELIHAKGVQVLASLGLREPLERAGAWPVAGFVAVPPSGLDPVPLPYSEQPGGDDHGLAMDHLELRGLLRARLAGRAEIRAGERVVDLVRRDGRTAGVRTAGGTTWEAPLTLVAEGRHARLRGAAGLEARTRLVSFTAAVLVPEAPLPQPGSGHVFLGAPGPILAYPISERLVRMCIDVPADAPRGREAIVRLLAEEYAPRVPEPLRGGMLAALQADGWELCSNHEVSTDRCTAPGLALVGDAAGCSHPLAATGMTIALEDARLLREELAADQPLDAALERYQARRYQFSRTREVLADALYEVFRGADAGTRAIREGIFDYWRSSARARATSMALLSGAESRLGVFLGEYLRVVGISTQGVLGGRVDDGSLLGRARSLAGLGRASMEKLGRVLKVAGSGALPPRAR